MTVQFIQARSTFHPDQFMRSQGAQSNRGQLLLWPTANTGGTNLIDNREQIARSADLGSNSPVPVRCGQGGEWGCTLTFSLPQPVGGLPRNPEATLLRVSIPYGAPATNFMVKMCEDAACSRTLPFVDVQARIDSTGRANDLFRRVEARVELMDVSFPFPEFAVTLSGDRNDSLRKAFWVTRDSWLTDRDTPNFGEDNL